MCVKSLGCRMFAFQCDAVSRLKSLTAITLKCMYLRTRWLAEVYPARQNFVERIRAYI